MNQLVRLSIYPLLSDLSEPKYLLKEKMRMIINCITQYVFHHFKKAACIRIYR